MIVGHVIEKIESLGKLRSRLSDAARNPIDDDNNIKISMTDATHFAALLDEEVTRLKNLEIKEDKR